MDFLKRYLVGLSPNTKRTLTILYRKHFEAALEETEEAETLLARWIEAELGASAIQKLMAMYRSYFRWKHGREPDMELVRRLMRRVNRKRAKRAVEAWTREQAEKALHVAYEESLEWHDRMLCMLHIGMRGEDLQALRWKDVRLAERVVLIVSEERSTASDEGVTKSGKSLPHPMSDELFEMFTRRHAGQSPDEMIFEKLDMRYCLEKVSRIANIPTITWHALRHTYVSLYLNQAKTPADVLAVSQRIGHSRPSTTMDIYWHLMPQGVDLGVLPRRRTFERDDDGA